jgi:hypothetical protein
MQIRPVPALYCSIKGRVCYLVVSLQSIGEWSLLAFGSDSLREAVRSDNFGPDSCTGWVVMERDLSLVD